MNWVYFGEFSIQNSTLTAWFYIILPDMYSMNFSRNWRRMQMMSFYENCWKELGFWDAIWTFCNKNTFLFWYWMMSSLKLIKVTSSIKQTNKSNSLTKITNTFLLLNIVCMLIPWYKHWRRTLISIRRLFKSRFQISLLLYLFKFEYIMHSYVENGVRRTILSEKYIW